MFFLKKLLSLLFENTCPVCKQGCDEEIICKQCEDNLEVRTNLYIKELSGIKIYAWGLYEGNLRDFILSLKNGRKDLADYFSIKLSKFWENINCNQDKYLVIYVPSHKNRIKHRGYCQTSLIAKQFAYKLNYDFLDSFIIRKKETEFMNKLNLEERLNNINGAFELIQPIQQNLKLIIIDDIFTSGSTMQEMERTIHKSYPELEIIGLTIAAGDKFRG